ncbi:MAG: hypothetical protein Q4D30_06370 [Bacteroidales bacterium]|nr:hypothetical protein [Bacteroidales bacterium]
MNKDNNQIIWKEIIFHCYKASKLWTSHLKDYNQQETDKKKSVLFSLSNRIGVNLHAVLELSAIAYKKDGLIYYKFPVGLLLRNCLIDSIIGLYVLKQDDKRVEELMELWNRDYVNALFEEFEVYRDKVSFSGFDDVFSEHMYTMALEDTFLHYLELNPITKEIKPLQERHIWKAIDSKVVCPSYNKEEKCFIETDYEIIIWRS